MIFRGGTEVIGIEQAGGRVTGVRVRAGAGEDTIAADVVVSCAGFWGPKIGAMVGMPVPLLPLAHQYAITTPLDALAGRNADPNGAGLPILRHQDADLYYREHGDRIGIGSYAHRPMPVDLDRDLRRYAPEEVTATAMPSSLTFTADDFAPSWEPTPSPCCRACAGRTSNTASTGSSPSLPTATRWSVRARTSTGFYLAEAVWVTHSAGVARAVAAAAGRRPVGDLPGRVRRGPVRGGPDHRRVRAARPVSRTSSRSTTSCTRWSPGCRRAICGSAPSTPGSRARCRLPRGAPAGSGRTGTRPTPPWSRSCRRHGSLAGETVGRPKFSSPVAAVEAWKTRTAVAMFDMTPLKRIEVSGPGAVALLRADDHGQMARKPRRGHVLPDAGRGRRASVSDVTVARLGRRAVPGRREQRAIDTVT